MIVKSKRVRARGQALKRTLRHLMDGEDNDSVELLNGTVADLEDARADALRFGREYAVRHWIIAPAEKITKDQLIEFVMRLAIEFGFDPERTVIWKHVKGRATETEDGCAEHYHLCAAEIDPVHGGAMSSSNDWARHERLARRAELAWGHAIVPGRHTAAVVAALEREGITEAAATLCQIAHLDHPQSFDEVAHQRLKRSGFDLPRLRVTITEALSASVSRQEFETKLASFGLRQRTGDRKDTPIIETADGGTVIGSLARLTRLRKAALAERLKFNAEHITKTQAHDSSSHLPTPAATRDADRAGVPLGAANQHARRTASDGYGDRPSAADGGRDRTGPRQVGESGITIGRPSGGKGDQVGHSWVTFAAGCVRHRDVLLDLLGEARRSALSPLERTTSDLDDLIEQETRVRRTAAPPEPTSLLAARRKIEEAKDRLRKLETEANGIEQRLANYHQASLWRRFRRPKSQPDRDALRMRLDGVQRKVLMTRGNCAGAAQALKIEERKFQTAQIQSSAALSAHRAQADVRIATARAARTFLEKNPRAAVWGAPYLMRVAGDIQKARAEWRASQDLDLSSDWDLIPIFDLWGKPYLPPPKA